MSEDDEWMRAEDALVFVGNSPAALYAICARADAGLIKAKAHRYMDNGRISYDVQLPRDFWWAKNDMAVQNWQIGDFETLARDPSKGRLQAFGVMFRRSDIERMISPPPQGASGAPLSSTQTPAGSMMTTPTDGEWMSAYEALQFLQVSHVDAASVICSRAHVGLIRARAKLFAFGGEKRTDFEVPRRFWWAQGGAALKQNWVSGDFETWGKMATGSAVVEGRQQAFGVTFWRPDIEQLNPAIAASPTAPSSPAQRGVGRTVFIGHGGQSLEWLKLEKFLKDRLHLSPVEFNSTSVAGRATSERLMEMLDQADFAFLILTGEDEKSDGKLNPRLNVVHESACSKASLASKRRLFS